MQTESTPRSSLCAPNAWTERMVRRLAGTLVIVSLILAWKVSPWWFVLTGFVGVNLLQSSFSGFCPAEMFFRYLETRRGRKPAATH